MNSNHSPLSSILQKYEISPAMAKRLETLHNSKIVLILDDSSSMNSVDSSNTSRWNELSNFTKVIVEIAAVFNPNGCDVHFLNMEPVKNVRSFDQLSLYFRDRPEGSTPLSKTIQKVIRENPPQLLDNRNLLIIIATDGEPTDDSGYPNIPEFRETLANRPSYVYTSIVACTNDRLSIGYLNGLDRELPRLDVVDNYANESAEVNNLKGHSISFTHGDYVTKSIVGSISPDLDLLDEPISVPVRVPIEVPVQPQKVVPINVVKETPVVPRPPPAPPKKRTCCSKFRILSPDYKNLTQARKNNPVKPRFNPIENLQLKDIFCCQ